MNKGGEAYLKKIPLGIQSRAFDRHTRTFAIILFSSEAHFHSS